jgi:hypothetical protein
MWTKLKNVLAPIYPKSGTSDTPGSLPSGSAQDLATQLKQYIDNGKVKCVSGDGVHDIGCSDITNTASGISIASGICNADALDTSLLGMLLELVQMGHTFTLSAICTDHPSNLASLHHLGKAADFNTIDGVFMGQGEDSDGTIPWTQQGSLGQQKISTDKKLDQDIASFMPKSTTGFGQVQCHPVYDFLSAFTNFEDACHHQHVQIGS